jgi:AAA+ superfamily predicted ATPase
MITEELVQPPAAKTVLSSGHELLQAELRWLDLVLARQVARLRAQRSLRVDEFRGLYVSDMQVDALLRTAGESKSQEQLSSEMAKSIFTASEHIQEDNSAHREKHLPLQRLVHAFGLDEFERSVLLLGAAPELDLRYELLCSYLNNDVTRKRPTIDLALRLFGTSSHDLWERRQHFAPDAPLFRFGLLQWLSGSADIPASSLAQAFHLPLRVLHYLLDLQGQEAKLCSYTECVRPSKRWADLLLPSEFISRLREAEQLLHESPSNVLLFEGAAGTGKRACAEALCEEIRRRLLVVDVEGLMAANIELLEVFMLLGREQRLGNAGIYLRGVEAFFDPDGRVLPRARTLTHSLKRCVAPIVLGCEQWRDVKALLPETYFYVFRFPMLPFPLRREVWRAEIEAAFGHRNGADVDALANQFVLTGGQIRDSVQSARDDLRLRERIGTLPSTADLFAAARAQSQRDLGPLAQRIEPIFSWDDLVLPSPSINQLREIADAVRHRHIVYGQWGFEQRLSLGKGLKALFAGPSGTGKTMAAEVLARDLGLDLYKIDLATVVSKYIGETEKNLDRIFRAAQSSNAIIFFDEADALFGKRSEVKDAHDRYANIEVAYLLQRIEEYDGFVILATNLILNIDEAFTRRMNYTVEFPFPDKRHRELLWRGMFPPQTPLADDLDFAFLGQQFPMSGGNIKNAALAAAFLAAAEHSAVQMRHLIQSVAREWQKLGKLPSAADFKQYYKWALPQNSQH